MRGQGEGTEAHCERGSGSRSSVQGLLAAQHVGSVHPDSWIFQEHLEMQYFFST